MFMYMYSICKGIDSIMTPEEKTKLYTSIGYSGSSHNLALPKHVSGKYSVLLPCKVTVTLLLFCEINGRN